MNPQERNQLLDALLDGEISEADLLRLEAELSIAPSARRAYLDRVALSQALAEEAKSFLPKPAEPPRTVVPWLSWRPIAAAAAGVVFGMFCTSELFAYVAPSLGRVITLLQDGFESGPAPQVTGLPWEIGKWSGDFTEIVGDQQGVKPAGGGKMLRFLRADHEGMPSPEGRFIGDLDRLVDVRAYRREFGDRGGVVQLSAVFNAIAFPADESFECSVTVYALDTETALALQGKLNSNVAIDSLAMARSSRLHMDRVPKTWEPVTAELMLPAKTDFLLLHLAVAHSTKSQRRVTFDGHYLDDVRLTLVRRASLSNVFERAASP